MRNSIVKNLTRGFHIYVNIDNFDEILKKEENEGNGIKHSLKLLNSFFVSIRKYVSDKNKFPGMKVEKVTGNRMHLYIEATNDSNNIHKKKYSQEIILLAIYARHALTTLNEDVAKLNSINDAVISIGSDYGKFRCFEIYDDMKKIDEETSIGFATNYACKLQIVVGKNKIAISDDVFNYKGKRCTCVIFNSISSELF